MEKFFGQNSHFCGLTLEWDVIKWRFKIFLLRYVLLQIEQWNEGREFVSCLRSWTRRSCCCLLPRSHRLQLNGRSSLWVLTCLSRSPGLPKLWLQMKHLRSKIWHWRIWAFRILWALPLGSWTEICTWSFWFFGNSPGQKIQKKGVPLCKIEDV